MTMILLIQNRRKEAAISESQIIEFARRKNMDYLGGFNPALLFSGISAHTRKQLMPFLSGVRYRMYQFLTDFYRPEQSLSFFSIGQRKRIRHALYRRVDAVEKVLLVYSYQTTENGKKYRQRKYVALYKNPAMQFEVTTELGVEKFGSCMIVSKLALDEKIEDLESFDLMAGEIYREACKSGEKASPSARRPLEIQPFLFN